MKDLRLDAEKFPIYNAIITVLLAIAVSAFPFSEVLSLSKTYSYYLDAAFRLICSSGFIYLAFTYGFGGLFKFKAKKIYALLPCYLVAVNNFPFIALLSGQAYVDITATEIIGYALFSLSVALFEEVVFRGIVFPLIYLKTKNYKHGLLYAILISSLIFGGVHLVNIFGGSDIGAVLLQMFYTFLMGCMCCVAFLVSQSVLVPFTLHFIFNFGGLFVQKLGGGNYFNTPTVIITIVLGVIVGVYVLILALKLKNDGFDRMINRENRRYDE